MKKIFQKIIGIIGLCLLSLPVMAAEEMTSSIDVIRGFSGMEYLLITLAFFVGLLMITLILIFYAIYLVLKRKLLGEEPVQEQSAFSKWFWDKFNGAAPVEEERNIDMGHEYDGIRELDNDIMPWLKWGFNITVVFSIGYMYYYHFSGNFEKPISIQELHDEQSVAKVKKDAYLAKMANLIDESNVEATTSGTALAAGEKIFMQNCRACHGGAGEGGVGPNLTDEYWLHGGGITNIFKTVKYGVPEKGMLAWQDKFTPQQIQQVSSYILTLVGTNPPKGKAAQGTIWKAEE